MYDWPRRPGFRGGPGGDKPRFNPFLVALPLTALLLFNMATGRIDLSQAFGSNEVLRQLAEAKQTEVALAAAQQEATATANQVQVVTPERGGTTSSGSNLAARRDCEPAEEGIYCLYTVQEGDSLAAIASHFRLDTGSVPGWELLFQSNRPGMPTVDEVLTPGQVLRVPVINGIVHDVMPGDTVSGLAVEYDVTSAEIVEANNLTNADDVQIGDVLLIPRPAAVPPLWQPDAVNADEPAAATNTDENEPDEPESTSESEPGDGRDDFGSNDSDMPDDASTEDPDEASSDDSTVAEDEAPEPAAEPEPATEPEPVRDDPPPAPAVEDPRSMSWPVEVVRVTNYMSARHPLGMDFGLAAAPRSSIMAAASGTVSFSGGNACCSYGLYVIVDHGDGLQTLYAHLSSLAVKKGDYVNRGQSLGIAGNTGNSRGVHLHFEVYRDGKRVDPMLYLPN